MALAVAQEALRVKPLASVIFRQTTEDISIGDVAVPEGTVIAMCPIKVRCSLPTALQCVWVSAVLRCAQFGRMEKIDAQHASHSTMYVKFQVLCCARRCCFDLACCTTH